MKRMYKQPETEIAALETAKLMDTMKMSEAGENGGGGGSTEAPARHSTALPVPGGAL